MTDPDPVLIKADRALRSVILLNHMLSVIVHNVQRGEINDTEAVDGILHILCSAKCREVEAQCWDAVTALLPTILRKP